MYTPVAYQGNENEEKVFKKRKVFKTTILLKSVPPVAHFPAFARPNITTRELGQHLSVRRIEMYSLVELWALCKSEAGSDQQVWSYSTLNLRNWGWKTDALFAPSPTSTATVPGI